MSEEPITYGQSGVDLDAAERHTAAISGLVSGGVAGFAGEVALPPLRDPVILAATDGVGTKLLLALELGHVDGLGQDLVAMCVNDLACAGAKPIAFLDYMAVGRLDPERAPAIVRSIADACAAAGCPLVGGETAEMPGLYAANHFDLAGFAIGAVERDARLGPERVGVGDPIVGIPSTGLHSNGFSLVRRLLEAGAIRTDADELLRPTRLHSLDVGRLLDAGVPLRAAAHITGGGLPENLPRALPPGARARLDPSTWSVPAVIQAMLDSGRVDEDEAWRTFNMGLGMCLVTAPEAVDATTATVPDARIVGVVEAGEPGVRFG